MIAISGCTKNGCSSGSSTRSSRLILANWDSNHPDKYRKILFVEPTGTVTRPDFKDIPSSGPKKLCYDEPGKVSKAHPWVSAAESISYWEDPNGPDLLWSLREGRGARDVFAVKQASYGG